MTDIIKSLEIIRNMRNKNHKRKQYVVNSNKNMKPEN